MNKRVLVFYFLLFLILIFEGSGIKGGGKISYLLIIFMSLILFLLLKSNFKIPKKIWFPGVLFLLFSALSTIFSPNITRSVQFFFFYVACFLIFLFTNNFKEEIKRFILPFILSFGFIFSIYSIFLNLLSNKDIQTLIPNNGFQLVYSYAYSSHNHLGDFLLLPIIILLYNFLYKKFKLNNLLALLFFLPFFIFAFSRSAYLDLVAICFVLIFPYIKRGIKINAAKVIILLVIILTSYFFLFSTTTDSQVPFFSRTNIFLKEEHSLGDKFFLAQRLEYTRESVLSIMERPVLGVGPGNFYLASIKYSDIKGQWTESAHNIFLDMIAENGILAGAVFMLIIIELFRRSEKNIFFFLALALLLNFQTDYTYRIYSLLLLFFILLGICYGKTTNTG